MGARKESAGSPRPSFVVRFALRLLLEESERAAVLSELRELWSMRVERDGEGEGATVVRAAAAQFAAAEGEYGAPPTAVVSWGFWQRHLGGDASAIGRPIRLDGQDFTVIGFCRATSGRSKSVSTSFLLSSSNRRRERARSH